MRRWRRRPARRGAAAGARARVVALDVARERVVPCHALLQLHARDSRSAATRSRARRVPALRARRGAPSAPRAWRRAPLRRAAASPARARRRAPCPRRRFFLRTQRRRLALSAARARPAAPPRRASLSSCVSATSARARARRSSRRARASRAPPRRALPLAQRRKRLRPGGRLSGSNAAGDGALDAAGSSCAAASWRASNARTPADAPRAPALRAGASPRRACGPPPPLGEVGAVRQRGFRSLTLRRIPRWRAQAPRRRRCGAGALDAARSARPIGDMRRPRPPSSRGGDSAARRARRAAPASGARARGASAAAARPRRRARRNARTHARGQARRRARAPPRAPPAPWPRRRRLGALHGVLCGVDGGDSARIASRRASRLGARRRLHGAPRLLNAASRRRDGVQRVRVRGVLGALRSAFSNAAARTRRRAPPLPSRRLGARRAASSSAAANLLAAHRQLEPGLEKLLRPRLRRLGLGDDARVRGSHRDASARDVARAKLGGGAWRASRERQALARAHTVAHLCEGARRVARPSRRASPSRWRSGGAAMRHSGSRAGPDSRARARPELQLPLSAPGFSCSTGPRVLRLGSGARRASVSARAARAAVFHAAPPPPTGDPRTCSR